MYPVGDGEKMIAIEFKEWPEGLTSDESDFAAALRQVIGANTPRRNAEDAAIRSSDGIPSQSSSSAQRIRPELTVVEASERFQQPGTSRLHVTIDGSGRIKGHSDVCGAHRKRFAAWLRAHADSLEEDD